MEVSTMHKNRTLLWERGYCRFDLATHLRDEIDTDDLHQLVAEFDDLPVDPYACTTNRYRRYAAAILLPWDQSLHWIPAQTDESGARFLSYGQDSFNNEHPSTPRRFPTVRADLMHNRLLDRIVATDYAHTWWTDDVAHLPLVVGVHFIKLSVQRADDKAAISPNCLHQDGEPFHFAHLIYRRNVIDGRNVIATPECAGKQPGDIPASSIIDTFTLTEPLQAYAIRDAAVSHHLEPIRRGPAPEPGERAVLLVDITPMTKTLIPTPYGEPSPICGQ
jgi:hypothetical protein